MVRKFDSVEREAEKEAPVEIRPKNRTNNPIQTRLTTLCAILSGPRYVSRQSPNSRRRKGTVKGPGRVQARDRREVRTAILHYKSGWKGCSSVSLRGMGADRAETGRALHFQPHEEKVSGPGELLRPDGGNGWSGAIADSPNFTRGGADQRRSCGYRQLDPLDRAQPGRLPQADRGRTVHF